MPQITEEQINNLTKQLNDLYCESKDLAKVIENAEIRIGRLEAIIKEEEGWIRELIINDVSPGRKAFILEQITPKEYLKEE